MHDEIFSERRHRSYIRPENIHPQGSEDKTIYKRIILRASPEQEITLVQSCLLSTTSPLRNPKYRYPDYPWRESILRSGNPHPTTPLPFQFPSPNILTTSISPMTPLQPFHPPAVSKEHPHWETTTYQHRSRAASFCPPCHRCHQEQESNASNMLNYHQQRGLG